MNTCLQKSITPLSSYSLTRKSLSKITQVRSVRKAHRLALNPLAVASPIKEPETDNKASKASEATSEAPSTSGRIILESPDELKSTTEHRLWVGGATVLMALTMANGLAHCDNMGDNIAGIVAFMAAYVMSDFGTGVYHWAVDNYGSGKTPIFGEQIAAFQGHHQRPWTITEREFCNNVHKVFKPAAPFAALLFISSFLAPPVWSIWSSSFLFLACMSQQFHAWSHMKKSELNPVIVALQDAGLLISRKDHGAHHKAPFEGYYCIVSGWCNGWLDADGSDDAFFRRLERFIADKTGVEPRCWYPPQEDWEELERA